MGSIRASITSSIGNSSITSSIRGFPLRCNFTSSFFTPQMLLSVLFVLVTPLVLLLFILMVFNKFPSGQPCFETIESDLLCKLWIAAMEERYKEAGCWNTGVNLYSLLHRQLFILLVRTFIATNLLHSLQHP